MTRQRTSPSMRAALCGIVVLLPALAGAATSVTITRLVPDQQPAGATLLFRAVGSGPGLLRYRFEIAAVGGARRIVRDFAVDKLLDWTPLDEGSYLVFATVESSETGERAEASALSTVVSRVTDGMPVVSSTVHPLVALYSAPPCAPGSSMRVVFVRQGSVVPKGTPWKPCRSGRSLNFYVAGLRGTTTYALWHEIAAGGVVTERGPALTHTSGAPVGDVPRAGILDPPDAETSLADSVLLFGMQWNNFQQSFPFAVDLAGHVIWYYDRIRVPAQQGSYLLRPAPGGTFLIVGNDATVWRVLREVDLAGHTLRETNTTRISDQLALLGHDRVTSFHHEALRLPNGHTLVLASAERLVTDVQQPGTVDVLGDLVIDLDENWQVVWVWNSFDHLDLARAASLRETCAGPAEGCPHVVLAARANDWTHTNSIAYSNGDLVLSIRNQDWIVKIDYDDGAGTGAIVWRLGRQGDFALIGGDPSLWFSHQHDAQVYDGGATIALYDNGNFRCELAPAGCSSRGQVLVIDEEAMVARVVLNADLVDYSAALGSAQRLANGNYHFWSGIAEPGPHGEAFEFTPSGRLTFFALSRSAYRAFRLRSLYGP